MRSPTDDEIKLINANRCPRCASSKIETEFMRVSLDMACLSCETVWSTYKSGKIVIW